MHLPLSFLLCSPELPHSTTMSPCLLFVSQMSLPVQFQLFCLTHQETHPCLPESWSTLRCCFVTHSFTITLQSHISFKVLPSAHHIIYLGTFSSTLICHLVFIFFLEINIDNRQIHPFLKIHNH